MKSAFLVLGPERSGTRLMARILVEAGCYGDHDHEQRLDHAIPDDVSPVVWRRSVPHRREWTDVLSMARRLRAKGYDDIRAVVMTRDWFAVARSQEHERLVPDLETAYRHQQRAYTTIFVELMGAKVPFVVVTYEHLVQRPAAVIANLAAYLGLTAPQLSVEVYDGNEKWYT